MSERSLVTSKATLAEGLRLAEQMASLTSDATEEDINKQIEVPWVDTALWT